MRPGLLVSGRHSLPRPWAPRSRLLLRSRSRLVVAKSSDSILLVTTSALVPPIRVPRRLTTGRLINSLTFSAQHTKVKTQQVARSRGQQCGDIELAGYLANAAGPVPLVLDLRIAHQRFGSSSDPSLNGHLHYPSDIDRSLNEAAADKIRKYRADCKNNPPHAISFMPAIARTSGRLHSDFVRLLFLQDHRETDRFFAASGVQLAQSTSGLFHFRRAAFSSQFKSKVGSTLANAAALRINLNLDGVPVTPKSHTHPSHSQTSHL
jgi:hypothetical protein